MIIQITIFHATHKVDLSNDVFVGKYYQGISHDISHSIKAFFHIPCVIFSKIMCMLRSSFRYRAQILQDLIYVWRSALFFSVTWTNVLRECFFLLTSLNIFYIIKNSYYNKLLLKRHLKYIHMLCKIFHLGHHKLPFLWSYGQ